MWLTGWSLGGGVVSHLNRGPFSGGRVSPVPGDPAALRAKYRNRVPGMASGDGPRIRLVDALGNGGSRQYFDNSVGPVG
jgi:hypothetical protein